MNPIHEFDIFTNVHAYAKIYPRMTKLFVFDHPSKVRIAGFEPRHKKEHMHSHTQDPVSIIDSLRRTKTRLRDIVACNDFDLFCTFTFANDRQDVDKLKRQMSTWLKNQQKRTGKFDYLIVPEFHKDGKSIHFHALFKGYKGKVVDSGHRFKGGRKKYEFKSYTLGINSAAMIDQDPDSLAKVGSYIGKYITKDMPQFDGKKRYWCSQGLTRPITVMNPILFPSEMHNFDDGHHMNTMMVHIAPQQINFVAEPLNMLPKSI